MTTETAASRAGYEAGSTADLYAAAGGSLAGSLGTILDSLSFQKQAWSNSYNHNLEATTAKNRIKLQNQNNSQVAGFNLQQLAIEQTGIENQGGIDFKVNSSREAVKQQAGTGGITSDTVNPAGTGNFLQTAMLLKQNKAKQQEALMRLAQGYQLPIAGTAYQYQTPWDTYLGGVSNAVTGINKLWKASPIVSSSLPLLVP